MYPDASFLDEATENRQLKLEEEMKNLPVYMMERKVPPRSLLFYSRRAYLITRMELKWNKKITPQVQIVERGVFFFLVGVLTNDRYYSINIFIT
jgi:hypothetical protein